ncbi:MAG: response regulator [Myxococcales bacterium]|nr:response regulator [Myxococcales bacterium]
MRVVVVDDSAMARWIIQRGLETELPIDVVGVAGDALAGIRCVEETAPDAVVMDVEMPGMDGIEAIAEIHRRWPTVANVVFTGSTRPYGVLDARALAAGAIGIVRKPPPLPGPDHACRYVQEHLGGSLIDFRRAKTASVELTLPLRRRGYAAVVLGASTGGPDAVELVLRALPRNFPLPLLIVQHIGAGLGSSLLARFSGACALPVLEGTEGVPVLGGRVYLATAGRHMQVRGDSRGVTVHTSTAAPEHHVRPAVDVLFRSAAAVWGRDTLAVLLTGMGEDGAAGCRLVKSLGGGVLAQDRASCAVWGMPAAVARSGTADRLLPITCIGAALVANARSPAPPGRSGDSP